MHKKKDKIRYRRLQHKIFMQTAGMMLGAFACIMGLYIFVLQGKFANAVVGLLTFFGLKYNTALEVYWTVVRNNTDLLIMVAVGICFFFFFRFFLSWFTRYFNEIDRGVDQLLDRGEGEIQLSKEMEPMEQKLNQVRRTLEQQINDIQESERKKDELVMYLAHDIRTPLTSVIGYLSLLEEMPDLTGEQREKFVHVTLEKAKRLELLVNEFFDITRFNRKNIALTKEKIDLYYMLVQLKDEAYPQLQASDMDMQIQADENCSASANADKLARVFNNLIKNAIAYGTPGSTIRIMAEEEQDKTVIRFENQGETIPLEEQKHLFDKFYRMDKARQTDHGGAGLGLAISKELIVMHGGDITVRSENGITTFQIVLPKEYEISS